MTREEAIRLLICESTCVEDVDGNIGGERVRQAYAMAIEALQADAVSRKDTVTLNSPISILSEMVAVVRCKDCKRWKIDSHCDGYRNAEDFCSWGERREP